MQLPLIAVLLAAGIVAGIVFPGKLTGAFGTATLWAFLPALIFEGSWRLQPQTMRRMAAPIAMLAVPGVLVTAAIVAACIRYAGHLAWPEALMLGAILSATDPVAVLAIFRRLRLPRELTTIVESEALLNDAVAVMLYRGVLAAIAAGVGAHLASVAGFAILGAILGAGTGLALGYVAAWILGRTSRGGAYIAVTIAGAYGAYYVATLLDWSGIFGVIAFAIALRVVHGGDMAERCAETVGTFWEAVSLAANAALFFLIGAALNLADLRGIVVLTLVAVAVVFAARFVIVYGLLHLVRPRIGLWWMSIVRMAGIRGALSLALALALPKSFAGRDLVIDCTFAVVVVTIFAGSLTLERRVKEAVP